MLFYFVHTVDSFCIMLRKRVYPASLFDALLTLISSDREEKEWTTTKTSAEEYAKRMIMSSGENVCHMIIT